MDYKTAKLTDELLREAIANRLTQGKVALDDLTLYKSTLEHSEWAVEYYKQKEAQQ